VTRHRPQQARLVWLVQPLLSADVLKKFK